MKFSLPADPLTFGDAPAVLSGMAPYTETWRYFRRRLYGGVWLNQFVDDKGESRLWADLTSTAPDNPRFKPEPITREELILVFPTGAPWMPHMQRGKRDDEYWERMAALAPEKYAGAGGADIMDRLIASRAYLHRWADDRNIRTNVTDGATPIERRGRKRKFDWDSFYIEVALIADLDGLPAKQADLEKQMAYWCLENWGEEPGVSAIRGKLSKVYQQRAQQHPSIN